VPVWLMAIVRSTCEANGDDPSVIFTFGWSRATAVGAGLAGCAPGDRPIESAFDPFETTNTDATSSTTKSDGTSLNPLPRLMGLGSSCIIILPRTKRPRSVKYDPSVENDARLDRSAVRRLVDADSPHGAATAVTGA